MEFVEVTTEQQAQEFIKVCPSVIAIDTEYIPGDPRTTQLTSVIIADEDRAWIIHPSFLPMLTPMLRARKLVFLQENNHNDTIILNSHGCDLRNVNCYNLIDMHHLIDETKSHALGDRVLEVYGDDYKHRLKGQYDNLEYQGKDGVYTYRLGIQDLQYLEANGLLELYHHVRRTTYCLIETSINGILVDEELMKRTYKEMKLLIDGYLPKLREEFNDACTIWELKKWTEEINKRSTSKGKTGVPRPNFSFTSNKQICWLLYEYLRIPIKTKTKKGNPSTDYETLKSFVEEHPRLQTLVEYNEIKSIFSTFVEGMLGRVDNGKIYPHFNVSGTDTGRISHSNPNMGNLPTTGNIRNFFLPSHGYSIIGADYTQLEVVIEAALTRDSQLLRVINEGVSKHDITAQGLGIDRNTAKTLNFALQYGAGANKVAKILGSSRERAQDIFKRYWELYSGVRTLKEETIKQLEETGQITNLFGRTRHFPPVSREWEVARQHRQAYNFLIQGVAGDVCNRAMWQMGDWFKSNGYGRVLFSVHDEIVCEVLHTHVDEAKSKLIQIMENVSDYLKLSPRLSAKSYGPLTRWSKT